MSLFSEKLALGRRPLNWRASTEPHHWSLLFSTVASGVRQNWGATYWVTKTRKRNPSLSTVPFQLKSKASSFVTSRRSQISAEPTTHGLLVSVFFDGLGKTSSSADLLLLDPSFPPPFAYRQFNPSSNSTQSLSSQSSCLFCAGCDLHLTHQRLQPTSIG
ncbi:hypothetical protein DdX_14636 [Ditylenchus destructor]|uniref:Uncharacterized protein n=1 Tax=Ditylenchus destructor TaxID=166010 RepID=A0AAD4MT03_9BILA|nr:hypothetical protein DdX_14636 [Ditylenchus destructor]